MKKVTIFACLFLLLMSGCLARNSQPEAVPTDTVEPTASPTAYDTLPQGSGEYPWWNDVVFYEVFVRSFYDSDGDGIGDLRGLIAKLDYLNDGDPETSSDLGINGIWLMPIFDSPSYHGYDVTDYYTINPDYGTMEDFQALLDAAHERGIRIIIDFVVNHTAVEHPWFKDARSGAGSAYRDWYVWAESDPEYRGPDGQDVWHFNYDNSYYYGVFWSGMPDLNYENPEVTEEIKRISEFWLKEVGVDGFRVDGAKHLIEQGTVQINTDPTYSWFTDFNAHNKAINPQLMTVGEVWDSNFSAVRYVKENGFDLVFDFELSESLLEGINGSDARKIRNALDFNTGLYPFLQKSNFLTNHDMNRVMNVFQRDEAKAKLGAFFLLTAPGVPFIYYGEEVGMLGAKPDEDIRRPMQWNDQENAGFSTFLPWRSVNSNYADWNAAVLRSKPDSLFNLYRKLIHLRNKHESLRTGQYQSLDSKERNLVAYVRSAGSERLLVIANVGNTEAGFSVSFKRGLLEAGSYEMRSLLSDQALPGLEITDANADYEYDTDIMLQAGEFLLIEVTGSGE